jgi:hypothetical protein
MKILPFLLFSGLFLLAFSSCYKGSDDNPTVISPYFNPIRPGAMQVGQKSRYLMLEGKNYFELGAYDDFEYLPDTLIVEITAQDGADFTFKEYFTKGSLSVSYPGYIMYDTNAVTYLARVENDTFKTIQNGSQYSRLFHYNNLALPLAHISSNQTTIKGWKTTLSYTESYVAAYTVNYNLFGKSWPFLNIIVNNTSMAFDGPGMTYMYEADAGIARTSSYSWWTQSGYGFDYLP